MPEIVVASSDHSSDPTDHTTAPVNHPAGFAPLYVERLYVHSFRGIGQCDIEFEPDVTILAGHNNSGKSRILAALNLALGGRPAEADDFTVGDSTEPHIDIVLAPPPPGRDSPMMHSATA